MMYQPLADLLRPQTLDEVVGQEHILGEGAVLRRLIESGNIPNMVFYGPSGTGKTTVANIIAQKTNRTLYKLNATTASTADIREITGQLDTLLAPNGVLLYLDEIQSFNKKQQQSLLEYIENGKITLIASTTENPYFYVFNAILSRSTVFEFKQISREAALKAVHRAVAYMEKRTGLTAQPEEGVLEYIAGASGGDLRKSMNAIEVLFSAARPEGTLLRLTMKDAQAVTQKSAMRADRDGDNFYDLLSALQKSIRGSDPDAACHYLARLLEAGQLQAACRRLMVIAAEDVGLAYPMIIPIVKSCVDMALMLGMPEARIPLGDAAVLMATSPKSNSGHVALDAALADVQKGMGRGFPRQLQNVHADTYTQERDQGYLYPHDYPNHWVRQQYLPDDLIGKQYYTYGPNKLEQAAKQYWDAIKKE
ncbi:MAG: replication-associated recombination protein A [Oscillospiraceae bacterium]|nr:replication-associated recombination protein A [Oscillospiraceae bacterium]MDD6856443.1 replication-associated recombination protein A [Oscillospiraceae bacterium]